MNRIVLYLFLLIFISLSWQCGSSEDTKTPPKSTNKVTTTTDSKITVNSTNIQSAVLKNDQWRFINMNGEPLTDEGYVYAENFSEGWACVNKSGTRLGNRIIGGKYYLINKNDQKSKFEYDEAFRFQEGRALVSLNNKKAIIDMSGNVITSGFDHILHFSNGLAPAVKGDLVGYLKKNGSWAFKVDKSILINVFSEGLAQAKKDKKFGFLNTSGEWAIPATHDYAAHFSEHRSAIKKNGKYGFIDQSGKVIIPVKYDDVGNFNEGMCNVKLNNKWGYIDKNGKLMIDFQFDECRFFHEGLAGVLVNNKAGFIDKKGKMVIQPKYKAVFDFSEGRAIVEANKKMGFIDKKGQLVIPAQYDKINPFVDIRKTNELFRK